MLARLPSCLIGFPLALSLGTGCQQQVSPYIPPRVVSTAKPVATARPSPPRGFKLTSQLTVPFYKDGFVHPVFSPNERWLAAPGGGSIESNGVVFLWDVKTGELKKRLQLSSSRTPPFTDVVWSPDGKQLAAWTSNWGFSPSNAPLVIWDAASGSPKFFLDAKQKAVTSACYSPSGDLLMAWTSTSKPSLFKSHIAKERHGKIQNDVALNDAVVVQLKARQKGPPLALVWRDVSIRKNMDDPLIQSSVCVWQNDQLSKPLIEFEPGERLLRMDLAQDEKHLALAGFKFPAPFYTFCDLSARKIKWRSQIKREALPDDVSVSRDSKWFWTRSQAGYLRFNARTGAAVRQRNPPLYFSEDETLAVQVLDMRVGDRSTGRTDIKPFGPRPRMVAAYLFRK